MVKFRPAAEPPDHLLPSQSKELARAIQESDLPSEEFEWADTWGAFPEFGDSASRAFVHLPSDYWFAFEKGYETNAFSVTEVGDHMVAYSPAESEIRTRTKKIEWSEAIRRFRAWLSYVEREVEAPDFWAVLRESGGMSEVSDAEEQAEEDFTESEREATRDRLDELEARITDLEDLADQEREFVRGQFADLRDEIDRMSKQRWTTMAIGTVGRLTLSQVVDTEIIRGVWEGMEQLLRDLGGGDLLPPP